MKKLYKPQPKCKNCDMRTKNGDCHQFCPSYNDFLRKNELYKNIERGNVQASNGFSYLHKKAKIKREKDD